MYHADGELAVYEGPIKASSNTVVRAISVREGYVTNYSVSGTFLFRSDDVNHALPVVTLVTDPANLWDEKTGIYAYGEQYDPDLAYGDAITTANYWKSKQDEDAWERPGCLGVFDESGQQVFSQNIGMRIAGSFGRGRAQKGFNIFARDEYGDNRMEYPFFENLDFTEYKSIVLRAGAQDQNSGKFRDELATGLLVGSDVNFLYQSYKPYVLYLNGEYWGVYFMKEKRNRFFVAQHEGTEDNVNLSIIRSGTSAYYGSATEWAELMSWLNGKGNDLSNASDYAYVEERVDLDSFMDYMICEIYSANSDVWNIQYYKVDGGKWKWIYYDFCWSFGASENRTDHQTLSIRRLSSKPCSDLFNALLKNSDWRDRFCRRFAELLNTIYARRTCSPRSMRCMRRWSPKLPASGKSSMAKPLWASRSTARCAAPMRALCARWRSCASLQPAAGFHQGTAAEGVWPFRCLYAGGVRMSRLPQYRHELKYYINEGAHVFLSKKLSLTMEQDRYARKNGGNTSSAACTSTIWMIRHSAKSWMA